MWVCLYAPLLTVWCVLVRSESNCDQVQFLDSNGTCVACPVCGPGEQLSEDCGFGDGGDGVCIPCEEGTFSTEADVAPCRRCTQCNLLNRREETACSPVTDALCGQCVPGFYELRSMTGEVELSCLPCSHHDAGHKECLHTTALGSKTKAHAAITLSNLKEPEERRVKEETFSVVLIGSATASSIFFVALLLWLFLLTAERFKQVPEYSSPEPEGLLSAADIQCTHLSIPSERAAEAPSLTATAEDPARGLHSVSHENELHPTSIVINVTTNIKSSGSNKDNSTKEEQQNISTEEMEQQLQAIWELTQGQSIEVLDYDTVQDLSLLLDSPENINILRRLGWSLGVPPQVIAHIKGFQDLFQYLRTSTYTLLPQLAQAAALLPHSGVVARIHRAVVNN
ncbi:tumor necrosis factor receptor superfamily member 19-like [Mugil cephalus]|uniref:tumor necrosis factor receptor superfamily member 19-like n=1 Tax=Mugil cephalus TaxID=48193 RepID=UPI001FB6BA9C|nr:tumor necrosis factor receptor superfamily member 19-like [Mugil cephalus]